MKGFSKLTLGLLVAAILISPRAGAQQFGLSVTASDTAILVSNSVTYTIIVTNLGAGLNDTFVTNYLSPGQTQTIPYTATPSPGGTYFTTTNAIVFELGPFPAGLAAQMTLILTPTMAGSLTNSITVAYPPQTTNMVFTNVVVQVTNLVIQADLGVTMTGPSQVVITNDWITYGVTVTNAGPNAAPNVILTNTLPLGIIQISPTNQPTTNPIPLGTLPSGSFTNLFFTVQPTNVAVFPFSASVGASAVTDTNAANNFASTNIPIIAYLPGTLVAVTNSAQNPDFVSGLMEQYVLLSNTGTNDVPAARLVVTGLTNRLYNAVGTNSGNPFVYYSGKISAGQNASLMLQFYPNNYFPLATNQLHAYAVPVPNWTPPAATATSTNVNISRIVALNNGWMLVEFPTVPGRTYTVVYSGDMSFSNAMTAPPAVVAPANWVQWIDYGPPATVTAPTNATARFYRVYQNP